MDDVSPTCSENAGCIHVKCPVWEYFRRQCILEIYGVTESVEHVCSKYDCKMFKEKKEEL